MARPKSPRPGAPSTRDRLLAAATEEFAARGYDGTKVDRIAARARLNKAMVYYHFKNKQALYQAILLEQFRRVSTRVAEVRDRGGAPEVQLRAFIEAVASELLAESKFPSLWLREVADGGRHLSAPVVSHMGRIVETIAVILAEGRAIGDFQAVNPFVTQIGIVAPLLFFAAAEPVRERFRGLVPAQVTDAQRKAVAAHVLHATLAAVMMPQFPNVAAMSSRREL